MAVELRNRLFGQFGGKFDISPTAVFDYPTIGELASHLVSQLPDADPSAAPDEPTAESEPVEPGTLRDGIVHPP